jgi:MinD-like ATPase involved in chromosome partitioning or flagellar assembly
VLLVDADVAKPDLLSALGIEKGPGLVDALADPSADPEDFVIRTDVEGLSVLSAGRKTHNVPELMASERNPGSPRQARRGRPAAGSSSSIRRRR